MIFDGHSDIFSDVRYKREAGETQVLKNHHLDRLRKGGIGGASLSGQIPTMGTHLRMKWKLSLRASREKWLKQRNLF